LAPRKGLVMGGGESQAASLKKKRDLHSSVVQFMDYQIDIRKRKGGGRDGWVRGSREKVRVYRQGI